MKQYTIERDRKQDCFDYMKADELINAHDEIQPGEKIKINSKTFKIGIIGSHKILLAKSKYTVNYCAVMFNDGMKGKMTGIPGLGTNADNNCYCEMYRNTPGAICQDCYGCKSLDQYAALDYMTAYNGYILTRFDIPAEYLPVYNDKNDIGRFECFGDLYSTRQAKNYIRIAIINQHISFVIMTKNPDILAAGFKALNITDPDTITNLSKVESALMINDISHEASYPWIDHIFIVCDPDYAKANDIVFTCCDGVTARECNSCRRCYDRGGDKKIYEIHRK